MLNLKKRIKKKYNLVHEWKSAESQGKHEITQLLSK